MLSFHLLAHSHLHTYTWIFFSSTLVRTCSSAHLYPNAWTGPPMQCNVLRQCTEMFGCSTALINCTDQVHCSTALRQCSDVQVQEGEGDVWSHSSVRAYNLVHSGKMTSDAGEEWHSLSLLHMQASKRSLNLKMCGGRALNCYKCTYTQ